MLVEMPVDLNTQFVKRMLKKEEMQLIEKIKDFPILRGDEIYMMSWRLVKYKERLRQNQLAQKWLTSGKFGECKNCGACIEEGRLKARLTAVLCIDCQQEEDRSFI